MIYNYKNYFFLAGTDEVGRGSLAGPVVAAAVIFPKRVRIEGLNDSKALNHRKRKELEKTIKQEALSFGISFIHHDRIDKINILNASHEAMFNAVSELKVKPDHLLIDGNSFTRKHINISYECIIKGDSKYAPIAAASILAKVARDEYMINMNDEHPYYNWYSNKGYATKEHINAIKKFGFSPIHRKSFKLKALQIKLGLK